MEGQYVFALSRSLPSHRRNISTITAEASSLSAQESKFLESPASMFSSKAPDWPNTASPALQRPFLRQFRPNTLNNQQLEVLPRIPLSIISSSWSCLVLPAQQRKPDRNSR